MLFRKRLREEIERKKDDISSHIAGHNAELQIYSNALQRYENASAAEKKRVFSEAAQICSTPADAELSPGSIVRQFGIEWGSHEAAREWALGILIGRTTFAADGSQLYVEKETTLPFGAVQIGWFENPHDENRKYEKDTSFELLTPADLFRTQDEPFDPTTRVAERRFHAEVERTRIFLDKHNGWQERGERMPLAFFDGTLLISFSLPRTALQRNYISAMTGLLRHSLDVRVPVIGYIDRSFARDAIRMLSGFADPLLVPHSTLFDGALLSRRTTDLEPVLKNWGDRTVFFYSRRSGLEDYLDDASGQPLAGFIYLQTTAADVPARLDIPAWIYEHGLLDEVVDTVRAECIVGLGYPYVLETADQAAVISHADRDVFLRSLQDLASREKLDLHVSRKSVSKARRR